MKSISLWAKNHPIAARWIIAGFYIALIVNSIWFGILLYLADWKPHGYLFEAVAVFFLAVYIFYPKKGSKKGWLRHSYFRQKTHDFLLALAYWLIIALGMHRFLAAPVLSSTYPTRISASSMSLANNAVEEHAASGATEKRFTKSEFRKFKKKLRQEIRKWKKELRRNDNPGKSNAAKVLALLFSIALAIFLGIGVAGLACQVSCAGDPGAGTLILLAGWTLSIFLAAATFRILAATPNQEETK